MKVLVVLLGKIFEELQRGHLLQLPLEKIIEYPSSSKVWDKDIVSKEAMSCISKMLAFRKKRQKLK